MASLRWVARATARPTASRAGCGLARRVVGASCACWGAGRGEQIGSVFITTVPKSGRKYKWLGAYEDYILAQTYH